MLGFIAWVRALQLDSARLSRLVLSGFAFLCAAGFREPFSLAILGPAIHLLLRCRALGCRRLAALLLAPAAALVLAASLVALDVAALPTQLRGWHIIIADRSDFGAHWVANVSVYARTPAAQRGWPLLLAGIVGVWVRRSDMRFHAAATIPSLALTIFYGTFEFHRRYALTPLILLAPFIAAGILAASDFLHRRLAPRPGRTPSPYRAACRAVLLSASIGTIGLLVVHSANGLEPWSPYVSRAGVRGAIRQIRAAIPERDAMIVTELRCRTLGGLLLGFTDHRMMAAWELTQDRLSSPTYYFEPISDEAYDRSKMRLPADIPMRTVLQDRLDPPSRCIPLPFPTRSSWCIRFPRPKRQLFRAIGRTVAWNQQDRLAPNRLRRTGSPVAARH
jgi:hypothetical protein